METLIHTLFSNNDNKTMMFAAIFSLLLVLVFVYLLHYYAQLFLARNRDGESSSPPMIPLVLGARFYSLRDFMTVEGTNNHVNPSSLAPIRGLDSSVISSIPKFVFKPEDEEQGGKMDGLECVICLSSFENGEVGRRIQSCHHAFHVECIDMWLYSHTTCPTCRAPAVQESTPVNIGSTRVVDTSSLDIDHEIEGSIVSNRDDQGLEMSSNLGEIGRMGNEGSSYMLEIIVEVPNIIENELSDSYHKKLQTSSNV